MHIIIHQVSLQTRFGLKNLRAEIHSFIAIYYINSQKEYYVHTVEISNYDCMMKVTIHKGVESCPTYSILCSRDVSINLTLSMSHSMYHHQYLLTVLTKQQRNVSDFYYFLLQGCQLSLWNLRKYFCSVVISQFYCHSDFS